MLVLIKTNVSYKINREAKSSNEPILTNLLINEKLYVIYVTQNIPVDMGENPPKVKQNLLVGLNICENVYFHRCM